MGKVQIAHPLARAEAKVFELARIEDAVELIVGCSEEPLAHFGFVRLEPSRLTGRAREPLTVLLAYSEKPAEVVLLRRASLDGEEIENLDEELRLSPARPSHGLDETLETRKKTIVSDAQEGAGSRTRSSTPRPLPPRV